jgi:hypothetical protein
MSLQLVQGEYLIKEGGATYSQGLSNTGGKLYLTNYRLVFQSHALNLRSLNLQYSLSDIVSAQPKAPMPTWMTVTLTDGKEHKLVVFERDDWIRQINQLKGSVAPPQPAAQPQASVPSYQGGQPVPAPISVRAPEPIPGTQLVSYKSRKTALLLEGLLGLLGLLGIGWIYSGKTAAGLIVLVGYLIWLGIGAAIGATTVGFSLLCTVPVNLVMVGLSTWLLSNHIKKTGTFEK